MNALVVDYVKKAAILLIVFGIGVGLGYFLTSQKVVIETKVVEVIKYLKAPVITQQPDGTIIASGGASLDSSSTESSYKKEEINKRRFGLGLAYMFSKELQLQPMYDVTQSFGVFIPFQIRFDQALDKNVVNLGIGGYLKF